MTEEKRQNAITQEHDQFATQLGLSLLFALSQALCVSSHRALFLCCSRCSANRFAPRLGGISFGKAGGKHRLAPKTALLDFPADNSVYSSFECENLYIFF
jgi:hypothetical protein